mgnify:CR=1 FL=1
MSILGPWTADTEARFREWEKALARPWNRRPSEVIGPISLPTFLELVPIIPQGRKRGRPRKVLKPDIVKGPGSLREKARQLGVGCMTVQRRLKEKE